MSKKIKMGWLFGPYEPEPIEEVHSSIKKLGNEYRIWSIKTYTEYYWIVICKNRHEAVGVAAEFYSQMDDCGNAPADVFVDRTDIRELTDLYPEGWQFPPPPEPVERNPEDTPF